MSWVELSQPYKQSLRTGLFKYLQQNPWAVTTTEITRDEIDGCLEELCNDLRKSYKGIEERENLTDAVSGIIRDYILRPAISKQQIIQDSLSRVGSIYFRVSIGVGSQPRNGAQPRNLLALKEEADEAN